MEVVDELQTVPLVLTVVLAFCLITMTYGCVYLFDIPLAQANSLYWYISRAAGFTGYELLALTALFGISTSSAFWDRWRIRRTMTLMHQFVSLMVLPFIALHLVTLHLDKSVPFSWGQIFLPFQANYRAFATGLGTLGMYVILVLVLTSYYRSRIGVRTWRVIHFLSFPLFVGVALHGILAGTDSGAAWAVWLYVVPFVLFVLLLIRRLRRLA